jgi:fatty acid desaturase
MIYGGWALLTWQHAALPSWLVIALGAWLLAWHSSLQHEIIHGHPTRWPRINRWLGMVPLSLWIPFDRYRATHTAHHRDTLLTLPRIDPESFYWSAEDWARLGPIGRLLARAVTTLAGRMLLGPVWFIARFWHAEARAVAAGDAAAIAAWREHLIWCVPILLWLTLVCHMSLLFYAVALVLPSYALTLVRSFAEHRAVEEVGKRIAIVENSWIFGTLFLFNNLHAVHHAEPSLAWYRLPGRYRATRSRWLAENGGLLYDGYLEVARRYLLHPHDVPIHPLAPAAPAAPGATVPAG